MEVKVIDNFLNKEKFNIIKSTIESDYFPWYYNNGLNCENDGKYQFTHSFYLPERGITSDYLNIFDEVFYKLNISVLMRAKANLNPKTLFKKNTGFHVDCPNVKTSIFYINTNNGGTKFKNGKFIKSVSNRLVLFDSNLKHAGITCTDQNRRIVLNFNFI